MNRKNIMMGLIPGIDKQIWSSYKQSYFEKTMTNQQFGSAEEEEVRKNITYTVDKKLHTHRTLDEEEKNFILMKKRYCPT